MRRSWTVSRSVLLTALLLVGAAAPAAAQPVDPQPAQPLVGPFLVRDLLTLLEEDPFGAQAAQHGVTAKAIRSAGELAHGRATFGLISPSWASIQTTAARQNAARDARWNWNDTYLRMVWRHIYRARR